MTKFDSFGEKNLHITESVIQYETDSERKCKEKPTAVERVLEEGNPEENMVGERHI